MCEMQCVKLRGVGQRFFVAVLPRCWRSIVKALRATSAGLQKSPNTSARRALPVFRKKCFGSFLERLAQGEVM